MGAARESSECEGEGEGEASGGAILLLLHNIVCMRTSIKHSASTHMITDRVHIGLWTIAHTSLSHMCVFVSVSLSVSGRDYIT